MAPSPAPGDPQPGHTRVRHPPARATGPSVAGSTTDAVVIGQAHRLLWSDLAGQSGRIVSAGGAGEECGHDVSGVPVERDPGPVVAHCGAGIGMAGGFLHIAQRNPGVERSGDERA
jgi:hypothetical protein